MGAHSDAVGIVTAQGAPGTLACRARDSGSGRCLFLSAGHLLFPAGTREGEPVWAMADFVAGLRGAPLGHTRWGRVGIVRHRDRDCFIDCAVGTLAAGEAPAQRVSAGPEPRPGEAVFKAGHGSGVTQGTVIAVDHLVEQTVGRRPFRAPGQILVQPVGAGTPFMAAADSGALLCNAAGQAIGLLWGVNSRGEGLACPLDAVIQALGITLEADGARAAVPEFA